MGVSLWLSKVTDNCENKVATWVSNQLSCTIEIGNSNIYWLNLIPKLHISNMRIIKHNQVSTILELEHIYLNINLLASIKQWQLVLNNASLVGLNIGLTRLRTGKICLTGLTNYRKQSDILINLYKYLSSLNYFDLSRILIRYIDLINTNLSGHYQLDNTSISHENTSYSMVARIELPDLLGRTVIFNGDMEWSLQSYQIQAWQWQLQVDRLPLQRLLNQANLRGLHISQGIVTLYINASGIGSAVNDLNIDMLLKHSNFIPINETIKGDNISINQVQGSFTWQQKQDNWRLYGHNIVIDINNDPWPVTSFKVKQDKDRDLLTEVTYLRLGDLSGVILLTKVLPECLFNQEWAGDITLISLGYYSTKNNIQSLMMTLDDVAISPHLELPGVSGLSGSIGWYDGTTAIHLDSHNITLYFNKWFKDTIFFDLVSGHLRYRQARSWRIEANRLQLWNDDLIIQINGDLSHDNIIIATDLEIRLDQVDIKHWQRYTPQKLLGQELKSWANSAFVAGKIIDGNINITGNLSRSSSTSQLKQGNYDMTFNVEGVAMHYAPDWPNLTGVDCTITGTNDSLTIKGTHGMIAGCNISNLNTIINSYINGRTLLIVNGWLTGTFQQILIFLRNTPLISKFGDISSTILSTGDCDIKLSLTVPLFDIDNIKVDGYIVFKQGEVTWSKCPKLRLSNIGGAFQFNNIGILAKNIKARLLGEAINIDMRPEVSETNIYINGVLTLINIRESWGTVFPYCISGRSIYQSKLSMYQRKSGQFTLDISLITDLIGISIDMPPPLGKKQDQRLSLSISSEYNGDALSYYIHYGEKLHIAITPVLIDKNLLGGFKLGNGLDTLTSLSISITGQVDTISIDDWLLWQGKQSVDHGKLALTYIDTISMNISKVQVYQQQLAELELTAERLSREWLVSLHSDQVSGYLTLTDHPDHAAAVAMDLDHLYLALLQKGDQAYDAVCDDCQNINLWSEADLHIRHLYIDNIQFGKINLMVTRYEDIWDVDAILSKKPVLYANIKGRWEELPTGKHSYLMVTADSDDFQGLSADFGYQPLMEVDEIDINFELSWFNMPIKTYFDNAVGQFGITIGKGKIIKVEPGATGRIFGLLGVSSILRRLALDFTDLFDDGFDFKLINGNFDLSNGIACTDDLSMIGQTANIDVVGVLNLVVSSYDQILTIIPNVSSTLPVTGVTVGGSPGFSVGTFFHMVDRLVDRLLDRNTVNLVGYIYTLIGSWDDPQLKIVNPVS